MHYGKPISVHLLFRCTSIASLSLFILFSLYDIFKFGRCLRHCCCKNWQLKLPRIKNKVQTILLWMMKVCQCYYDVNVTLIVPIKEKMNSENTAFLVFCIPVTRVKVCREKFDEEQNNILYESHREWKHLILELNKRKFDDNEEVPKTDFSFSTLGSKLPNFDVVWVKKWEKKYQLGFLASLFVKAVTDVKERATYFAKLGDFLLKTFHLIFSILKYERGEEKWGKGGRWDFLQIEGRRGLLLKVKSAERTQRVKRPQKLASFLPLSTFTGLGIPN